MRKVYLAIILLSLLTSVLASDTTEINECFKKRFLDFKKTYNRTYANQVEDLERCKVFTNNFKIIKKHNEQYEDNMVSYKLIMNEFGDLSNEEFVKTRTGLSAPPLDTDSSHLRKKRSGSTTMTVPTGWVPGTLDLRTAAIPVKNQLSCGSCWAFTATAMIEYNLYKRFGTYYDLSEQNSVDCARAYGCYGGFIGEVFEYYRLNGIDFEYYYPYTASSLGSCGYKDSSTYGIISAFAPQWSSIRGDEYLMAYILYVKGWIGVGISADALQFYGGGIVLSSSCSTSVNHAVTVVGYGRDSSGVDYWILRNSWGDQWGNNGYFLLQRGANACGIAHPYEGYRGHFY